MKLRELVKAVRARVCDSASAFTFRMGAGFPGDVNRTHPVSIEPMLIAVAAPPTAYGQAVIYSAANANAVRPFTVGDEAVAAAIGVTVRPFPTQASTGTANGGAAFGAATPPISGVIDIMRRGYIMVKIPAGQTPKKGDAVFIWCAASAGAHVQGGFENAASGGNTAALDPVAYSFNSPPDASGNVELAFKV